MPRSPSLAPLNPLRTMLTRNRIIETPNAGATGEILVVFADSETGLLSNVTVVDQELANQLAATPVMIPNPARAPLTEAAFAAAEAQLEA
jgi:hypothetical protein